MEKAFQSNLAEIELANMALKKGSDVGVKMYAQMMVDEHMTAQTELQAVKSNANSNANLNDSLDAD